MDESQPYQGIPGWGQGAQAPVLGLISTVATDSQDMVYVLCRQPVPVMHVFDSDGTFRQTWHEHTFIEPHGLWIDREDRVFVTDLGDNSVRIFNTSGTLLQTLGTPGEPGAPGTPFNGPTRAVPGPSGAIYVADGYGQDRVHKFAPDGQHLLSWGESGDKPGQFATPHSLCVDAQEHVYVVDRSNGRVQVFDGDGNVLAVWTGFTFPHDIFVTRDGVLIVTDCATRCAESTVPYYMTMPSRPISEWSQDGNLIRRWGQPGVEIGQFLDCPHSLWIDRSGDVYVSEVITPNRLQKFHTVAAMA